MSGAIGVSRWEVGTRGLWLEKRVALVKELKARGHRVDFVNRMTKPSATGYVIPYDPGKHELLIVEFGSSNRAFYGDDLAETERIVNLHPGRIVFVCDDPDLPYTWKSVDSGQLGRIVCWYNCAYPQPFGGQPEAVSTRSFPISGLQTLANAPQPALGRHLVYIGRPKGRENVFRSLLAARAPVQVYGRTKEWQEEFPGLLVHPAPEQVHRAQFYAEQLGSLLIADKKHKRLGWYTGRAFHAIAAGCPAVAEADHAAMTGLRRFHDATELLALAQLWLKPEERALAWSAQADWVRTLRVQCELAMAEVGL